MPHEFSQLSLLCLSEVHTDFIPLWVEKRIQEYHTDSVSLADPELRRFHPFLHLPLSLLAFFPGASPSVSYSVRRGYVRTTNNKPSDPSLNRKGLLCTSMRMWSLQRRDLSPRSGAVCHLQGSKRRNARGRAACNRLLPKEIRHTYSVAHRAWGIWWTLEPLATPQGSASHFTPTQSSTFACV